MRKQKSLADVADKRFRLAGGSYLTKHNPFFVPVDQARRDARLKGTRFTSFANYDYLGLSSHPAIKVAAAEALDVVGVGALASRLVGGERASHKDLERALAAFIGVEEVMTLVSGYLTNVTVISHIMGTRGVIFLDDLSHNSIISGCKSSGSQVVFYRHNDLDHLDQLLREHRPQYKNALIVCESLFSMDGDIVDLPRVVELKNSHDTWLLLDEAHSIGVLGEEGRGLCEYTGVDPNEIDLIIGTLSKSFASCGGFICAKSAVINWFRHTLPGFVYSVGLSPVISAAALAALELTQTESWRLKRLRRNSELFVDLARDAGLDTGPAIGRGVVPILFRDSYETLAASRFLDANGFYVPPIIQVGVPRDQPRLRFFLSASHSEADIRAVIDCLATFRAQHAAGLANEDFAGTDLVGADFAAIDLAALDLAAAGTAPSELAASELAAVGLPDLAAILGDKRAVDAVAHDAVGMAG